MAAPDHRKPWLAEKISQAARAAKPSACAACGSPVLAGLDGDLCAGFAVVDPEPVDYLTAVQAFISGRQVYAFMYGELEWMDATGLSRGGPECKLLVQHSCRGRTEINVQTVLPIGE